MEERTHENIELVKMSPKGQLVVPQGIREMQRFKPSERFIAFPIKEGVIFKRVKIPNVKLELKLLSEEIEAQFKKRSIIDTDVKEAVIRADFNSNIKSVKSAGYRQGKKSYEN